MTEDKDNPPIILSKENSDMKHEEAELKESCHSAKHLPNAIMTQLTSYFKAVAKILHIEESGPNLKQRQNNNKKKSK